MTITKLTAADAGCYVSSWWGQYGGAAMIQTAIELGWDDAEASDLATRHLACMGPSDAPELSDDEHAILSDAISDAETWLNDNVAPTDHSFGWHEGSFFLQSVDWWDEDSQL